MHVTTTATQHASEQADFADVIKLFDHTTKVEECSGLVYEQEEMDKFVDPDADRRCTLCGVLRMNSASLLSHKANVHRIDPSGEKIKQKDFIEPKLTIGGAKFRVF